MPSHAKLQPDQRRLKGVFYTPDLLAEWMVRGTLKHCLESDIEEPTLLDPACGAGAFLLAAHRIFTASGIVHPVRLMHGVDVDEFALRSVRDRLLENASPSIAESVFTNILQGDALTGNGWEIPTGNSAGLDWGASFSEVRGAGGFDVVIANPPYLREKDAREVFDRIAQTAWGRDWKEPRMDLWYYFLHRALDLVREGGILCFIVNSYWLRSTGARKLIARLAAETTFLEIVDFGDVPLFEEVQGRHMVFWLKKERNNQQCRIRRVSEASVTADLSSLLSSIDSPDGLDVSEWSVDQASLFAGGRISFERKRSFPKSTSRVGDQFEVRQGVAENPPTITRNHLARFPGRWSVGEGVFVLTQTEIEQLGLTTAERQLLRPYWETRELDRYSAPEGLTRSILYLTPKTAPEIDLFPNIKRHLERFRELLDPRREVLRGVIQWWHLHWPREERLFQGERIVSLQMGACPRFVYCSEPAVVGFSCHVIVPKPGATWSLPSLAAILNSRAGEEWFAANAKYRGKKYDIGGNVLKEFPLPRFSETTDSELTRLSLLRQELNNPESSSGESLSGIESRIDSVVSASYEHD